MRQKSNRPLRSMQAPIHGNACSGSVVCRATAAASRRRARDDLCAAGMAADHLVLDEADDGGEDRPAAAAAYHLADQGADVGGTRRTREGRNQRRQKLAAAQATDCARDRVAERTKADVLESSSRAISAERTGNDLDDEI